MGVDERGELIAIGTAEGTDLGGSHGEPPERTS
jgi:hypothetical protein